MRVPRFFAQGKDLEALNRLRHEVSGTASDLTGRLLTLSERDLIRQLLKVLRLRSGDQFLLLDQNRNIFRFELVLESKYELECRLLEIEEVRPRACSFVVGQALIKPERFEWAVEKLTELGVDRIVPLLCRRTVVKLDGRQLPDQESGRPEPTKLARWKAIAREAAEQSERAWLPDIVSPHCLTDFLHDSRDGGCKKLRFICAERSGAAPLVEALKREISSENAMTLQNIDSLILLVGPEGGFCQDEVQEALANGFTPVSLGSAILRSETAAIAAMSQIGSLMDIRERKFH